MNCIHGKDEQDYCSRCNRKKKSPIYIIQEILKGVPECPTVFLNEKEADKFYLRLVNDVHSTKFKKVKDAATFLQDEAEGSFHDIYYWATSPI